MGVFKSLGRTAKKGLDYITGADAKRKQADAANEATARQQALAAQAADLYGDPTQFRGGETSAINELLSGAPAQIDENAYQQRYVNPAMENYKANIAPAINEQASGNPWAVSRMRNQQNALSSLNNQMLQSRFTMQDKATQNKMAGIDSALQRTSGKANALNSQANMVQARAIANTSPLETINALAGTASNVANASGKTRAAFS